jgi:hypothetical protein
MPAILISILGAVLGGQSIGTALAALSIDSWLTIAGSVGGDLLTLFEAKLGGKHPAIDALIEAIKQGDISLAAKSAHGWFDNQPPTIPGYDAEGALTQIPNPDYRKPAS